MIVGKGMLLREAQAAHAMTTHRARRHVRARPPAAARAVAGARASTLPELAYPDAAQLRRRAARRRGGAPAAATRPAIVAPGGVRWTYAELLAHANRIAHVLVEDLGVVPGNRVLLRGAQRSDARRVLVRGAQGRRRSRWRTMPLLRATRADRRRRQGRDLARAVRRAPRRRARRGARRVPDAAHGRACSAPTRADGLEALAARQAGDLRRRATPPPTTPRSSRSRRARPASRRARCTSTATCSRRATAGRAHVLRARADDVFTGSPPLAFTFGLGGLLLFPMRIGAATLLLEKAAPDALLAAIAEHGATVLFTAPTSYRAMAALRAANATMSQPAQVRVGRRGAAGRDAHAVEGRDRHRDHRRHRRHRDAAHLHLARRGARAARRDGHAPCRATRRASWTTTGGPCRAGDGRAARGEGPDRLPLPRRRAPAPVRARRLELHRRRLSQSTPTATSSTRRAPTT